MYKARRRIDIISTLLRDIVFHATAAAFETAIDIPIFVSNTPAGVAKPSDPGDFKVYPPPPLLEFITDTFTFSIDKMSDDRRQFVDLNGHSIVRYMTNWININIEI